LCASIAPRIASGKPLRQNLARHPLGGGVPVEHPEQERPLRYDQGGDVVLDHLDRIRADRPVLHQLPEAFADIPGPVLGEAPRADSRKWKRVFPSRTTGAGAGFEGAGAAGADAGFEGVGAAGSEGAGTAGDSFGGAAVAAVEISPSSNARKRYVRHVTGSPPCPPRDLSLSESDR